ncbi:iron-sulfur cluster assembly protein [Nocardioides sp. NPDC051685]|uniref:iron-sulfur cluster assembly protein n=1 Tax=Nocardioides sp. NPDC051685 TaxID=3364334 RepID=UPI0037B8CF98
MTTDSGLSMALTPEDGPPDTSGFDPSIESALRRIADPCSIATGVPIDLVDMGLVLEASRSGSTANVKLQLTSNVCIQIGIIEAKIYDEVGAVDGIETVVVDIDHQAEWLPSMMADRSRTALRERRPFPLTVLNG